MSGRVEGNRGFSPASKVAAVKLDFLIGCIVCRLDGKGLVLADCNLSVKAVKREGALSRKVGIERQRARTGQGGVGAQRIVLINGYTVSAIESCHVNRAKSAFLKLKVVIDCDGMRFIIGNKAMHSPILGIIGKCAKAGTIAN